MPVTGTTASQGALLMRRRADAGLYGAHRAGHAVSWGGASGSVHVVIEHDTSCYRPGWWLARAEKIKDGQSGRPQIAHWSADTPQEAVERLVEACRQNAEWLEGFGVTMEDVRGACRVALAAWERDEEKGAVE